MTDLTTPPAGADTTPVPDTVHIATLAPRDAETPRPRTRWAAIVWGLFFAATAAVALWILTSTDRRTAALDAIVSLDAPTAIAIALLAVGVLVLVGGLAALLRRLQSPSRP